MVECQRLGIAALAEEGDEVNFDFFVTFAPYWDGVLRILVEAIFEGAPGEGRALPLLDGVDEPVAADTVFAATIWIGVVEVWSTDGGEANQILKLLDFGVGDCDFEGSRLEGCSGGKGGVAFHVAESDVVGIGVEISCGSLVEETRG